MSKKKKVKKIKRRYFHFETYEFALKVIDAWRIKQDPTGKVQSELDARVNSRGAYLYFQDKYLHYQDAFEEFLSKNELFKGRFLVHKKMLLRTPLDDILDKKLDDMIWD